MKLSLTKFNLRHLKNRSGQLAVEMVLLLALVVGMFVAVAGVFREQEIFARTIHSPWSHLAGMIQNGVWMPMEESHAFHPLYYGSGGSRISTPVDGDTSDINVDN